MTPFRLMTIALLGLSVFGCTDYDKMKTFLQSEYDKINPKGDMAICYYIGNVTYPYLAEPITYFLYQETNDSATKFVNTRLELFAQVGLLQELKSGIGKDGQSYPQYTLTELGKKYRWSFERDWGGGTSANENHFCFGRIVIEKVTEVKDYDSDYFGKKTVETKFGFQYRLENVPDWAKDPSLAIYGNRSYANPDYIYDSQVWLTKSGGKYYNYSSGSTIQIKIKKGTVAIE